MLNFIKKLFGASDAKVEVKPVEAQAEVAQPKTLEFHEEIRAQVDAEKAKDFPVKKPAVKAKTVKAKAKPAPAKATAKKAPAKKKSK